MKKRYLIMGLIALDIAAIPAAAQILDRVSFSVPQQVASVRLPDEPGLMKFVVTSNAPFAVISEGALGDMAVEIYPTGDINGTRFGDKAQIPGEKTACGSVQTLAPQIIYRADRKTAAKRGEVLDQSVIFEVRFDPETNPSIRFITEDNATGFIPAPACLPDLS